MGHYDILRRGEYFAENGQLVFSGYLLLGSGSPAVTVNYYQGIWKDGGAGLKLLVRTGSQAVGAPAGALWDIMPEVPCIDDAGDATFMAALRVGTGGVTTSNDIGVWTELGGGGLQMLFRKGDAVTPVSGATIGRFSTGVYASAQTGATTGEMALNVTLAGSTTDTAILRASVSGASKTVTVIARENAAATGVAGETFGNLSSGFSDPPRMDAAGNVAFAATTKPSFKSGIWYQPIGGSLAKVFAAGDIAPGTSNATFQILERPAMGSAGVMSFRGFLNADGDNSTNLKNDGIWRGSVAGGFTPILRRGDTAISGLPVGAKVGNVWSGWLTNANHGAWRAWVDVNGDGVSAAPTDVHGLFADTSGTMKLVVKVGDAAPGIAEATFTGFDLPMVGGTEQMAFIGFVWGTGITAGTNDKAIWREAAGGGALTMVLRTGDPLVTTQGTKTIANIDFPGTTQGTLETTDHRWEQTVIDGTGRLLVNLRFTDGSTSQTIVP